MRAEEEADGEAPETEAFRRLDNSDVSTSSQTVGLSYIGDNGFIGFAVHKFNSDYGVPGGHAEEGEEDTGAGITIGLDQTRIDLNGELELDGFIKKLQIFGGFADYEHIEFEAPGVPSTIFTNEGYEVRAEAIQAQNNGWAAAYGAQIRNRDFAAIVDEAFVPPTNTRQLGFYTFQKKEFGDLHLEAGARFESVKLENSADAADRTFDLFSVSGGGDIHLTDTVRLGGTVFRTVRAPTTEELFSNGPHLATNQFERGNDLLGKEIAKGIEAAFRHRTESHFITANVFYTDYANYIFEQGTANVEDGLPVFQFSSEDATFKGFEFQAGHDVATLGEFDVTIDGLAEYVCAQTKSGNLPRIPPYRP